MRHLALLLFPALAFGQLATYDSRFDEKPDWRPVVDLADRDRLTNPDFAPWMLQWATPALIDRETMIAVHITGTVAQARADLRAAIVVARPAKAKAVAIRGEETTEKTRERLLDVISRSSGNAQRNAIVAYLRWLTLEVEAIKEREGLE
jgi:hypothetical protein